MILRNQDGSPDYVSVMGIVAIAAGLLFVVDILTIASPYYDILLMWDVMCNVIAYLLFMVAGIVALVSRRKTCSTRIALAGIILGVSFILRNRYITENNYELLLFVVTIVSFLIGILTVVSSTALLCGYPRYSTRLFQCMGVMTLLEAYPFWALYNAYVPALEILKSEFYLIPNMAAYILMMVALHQESMRIPPVTEKIDDSLGTIKDMIYSDGDTYITPQEAAEFCRFVDSPEEGQSIDVTLRGGNDARAMSARRVNGKIAVEIVPRSGRNFMNGFRMEVREMVQMEDTIRIFGGPGMFIQIAVHPIPPETGMKTKIRSRLRRCGAEE